MKIELNGSPLILCCHLPVRDAVRGGLARGGHVRFSVASLIDECTTDDERTALAEYTIVEGAPPPTSGRNPEQHPLSIAAPTVEAALVALRDRAAQIAQERANDAAREAHKAAMRAQAQALLDGPVEDLIVKNSLGHWEKAPVVYDVDHFDHSNLRSRLYDKARQAADEATHRDAVAMLEAMSDDERDEALVNGHNVSTLAVRAQGPYVERAEALIQQKTAAERAERAARAAANQETIVEFLRLHGTPSQIERQAAGVLPEAEIQDLARDHWFAPWDSYPRYTRWSASDLTCECEDVEACFSTEDVATHPLTETQWLQYKQIRSHVADVPGAAIMLRLHKIECSQCSDADAVRLAARITIQWAGHTFAREYDL